MRPRAARPRSGWAAAALLVALLAASTAAAEEEAAVVDVRGTAFAITLPEGRTLAQDELAGVVLDVRDERGGTLTVRVDGHAVDPGDPAGEVVLYRLTARDERGEWRELCEPDRAGERWAFPLEGVWTAAGEHLPDPGALTVTCSSGAVGKCVRAGYKPWASAPDGTSLWDHHQACVRLFRADYCGDGRSWTRDGTAIDLYDRQGIQRDEPAAGMRFEAGWGKDGATCVARPRVPGGVTIEDLLRRCPARLADRTGEVCDEARALTLPGTLLLNKS